MDQNHSRWVYVLPILHLSVCAVGLLGYVAPAFEPSGIVFTWLLLFDFPASIVTLTLVWKHSGLAMLWTVTVGTAWWYLMSWVIEGGVYLLQNRSTTLSGALKSKHKIEN